MIGPHDPRHGAQAGYRAGCRMPTTGMVRRLRALNALGWTWKQLGDHLGISLKEVNNRATEPRTYCYRTSHEQVVRLYNVLSMQPPPQGVYHDRTRRAAVRKGWRPPLAWDDDTIDDPTARPSAQAVRRYNNPRLHLDDVEWLLDAGETVPNIAGRLGVQRDALWLAARRHGRDDLIARLHQRAAA